MNVPWLDCPFRTRRRSPPGDVGVQRGGRLAFGEPAADEGKVLAHKRAVEEFFLFEAVQEGGFVQVVRRAAAVRPEVVTAAATTNVEPLVDKEGARVVRPADGTPHKKKV